MGRFACIVRLFWVLWFVIPGSLAYVACILSFDFNR